MVMLLVKCLKRNWFTKFWSQHWEVLLPTGVFCLVGISLKPYQLDLVCFYEKCWDKKRRHNWSENFFHYGSIIYYYIRSNTLRFSWAPLAYFDLKSVTLFFSYLLTVYEKPICLSEGTFSLVYAFITYKENISLEFETGTPKILPSHPHQSIIF